MFSLLDELRSIAQEGQSFAQNDYDKQRYKRLLQLASTEYANLLNIPVALAQKKFEQEQGSITPKLGIEILIINTQNECLILRRIDDDRWCFPCGWVEVGETPTEAAIRETKEETGIEINPIGYIAITSKGPDQYPQLAHQVNIFIATRPVTPNTPISLSLEHSQYQWVKREADIDWHPGHERLWPIALQYLQDNSKLPIV